MIDLATLASLEAEWSPASRPEEDRWLPVRFVEVIPSVFQPRKGYTERTGIVDTGLVVDLAAQLMDGDTDIAPITVLKVGNRNVLIDGHHRLAAYKVAGRSRIPVVWYTQSPKSALIEAGRQNAKRYVPLTNLDRQERAWALVCSELPLTKAETATGAGVSQRQVANMRVRLKEFRKKKQDVPSSWWETLSVGRVAYADGEDFHNARQLLGKRVQALNAALGTARNFKTDASVALLGDALMEWGPSVMVNLIRHLLDTYGLRVEVTTAPQRVSEAAEAQAEAFRPAVSAQGVAPNDDVCAGPPQHDAHRLL